MATCIYSTARVSERRFTMAVTRTGSESGGGGLWVSMVGTWRRSYAVARALISRAEQESQWNVQSFAPSFGRMVSSGVLARYPVDVLLVAL